jgi:hypothetical protein
MDKMVFHVMAVLMVSAVSFSQDLVYKEGEYLRIQSFRMERFGSSIIDKKRIGESDTEGQLKIGREDATEEGLLKWLKDDSEGCVVEIEFLKGTIEINATYTLSEWVRKDRESIKLPYTARAVLYRDGREVPLEIEIIKGVCKDAIDGSQHRRALHILHDLMLTVLEPAPFETVQKANVLKVTYPDKILFKGIGVQEFWRPVYYQYPTELNISYAIADKQVKRIFLSSWLSDSGNVKTSTYVYDVRKKHIVHASQVNFSAVEPFAHSTCREILDLLNAENTEGTREFRFITLEDKIR